MSSSYSSLRWVLSLGPISLCVGLFVFMRVYFVFFQLHIHYEVDLMGLKPNP